MLLLAVVEGGSIAPSFSTNAFATPTLAGATTLLLDALRVGALTGASACLRGVALRLDESEVADVRPETEVARDGRPATELRAESDGLASVGDVATEEGRGASLADPLDEVGDCTEPVNIALNWQRRVLTTSRELLASPSTKLTCFGRTKTPAFGGQVK